MNDFVKFWSKKRLSNKHVKSCIILIALVITPVVCALILSNSMIRAMSDKYIYLSSGHLSVASSNENTFSEFKEVKYSDVICSGYVMMYSQDQNTTLYVKGVSDSYFNDERMNHITINTEALEASNLNGISISEYTATLLNLRIGDKVAMMIVPDVAGKSMRPVIVRIESIYSTGYEAIDSNLAFISYDYAKTLFISEEAIGTELILNSEKDIDSVRSKILSSYNVSSWMSANYSVFSNFVMSKQVIFIILIVVVIMAAFYIASSARLANEDCMREIAIYKMIGANNKYIFNSSLYTMMFATILGIIFGLILGILISFNFAPVLKLLAKSNLGGLRYYLFDFKPIIEWGSILLVIGILLFVSFISVSLVLKRTKKITPIQLFNNN